MDWMFVSPKMHICCCCSVPQSCPTLCDPMNCSTPGFPILHCISWSLLKLTSIELLMPSNHLVLFHLLLPSIRSFPMSWLFTSGGQSIGASASASVLPMNIQGWFPLELTGLISLQSKGLSRVFSSTTVQRINSSALGLLYGPTLTHIHDYWKNHSFWLYGLLSTKWCCNLITNMLVSGGGVFRRRLDN